MLNNIYLKFSEYALLRDGQHPFANKYGATAEAILTEYTTNEDIVNSSVECLVAGKEAAPMGSLDLKKNLTGCSPQLIPA